MKQKEIYFASLEPVERSEQGGIRPVVIISGNTINENLNVCIVCPLASQVKNFHTCVQIEKSSQNQLKNDSEILTFQVRVISKSRLLKKIGEITDKQLMDLINNLIEVLIY